MSTDQIALQVSLPKTWRQINPEQVYWLSVNRPNTQHFTIFRSDVSNMLEIAEFHHILESDAVYCKNNSPYFIERSLIESLPQEFRDLENEKGS